MSNTNEQSELLQALGPVMECFESHDIYYFIGGSVASSHHGAARSALNVDLSSFKIDMFKSNHRPFE
jgi:hypothetical protein